MRWGRFRLRSMIWYVLAVVGAAALFALLYAQLPWWLDGPRLRGLHGKEQADLLGGDRGDVLKMVAGAGALIALVYTARRHSLDRQTLMTLQQGQVTDRYATAIGQLASDKVAERMGGIYALERIMNDSARDHLTVVEVLAAFVREQTPRTREREALYVPISRADAPLEITPLAVAPRRRVPGDVLAAMIVLARRPDREEPNPINLRYTDLAGLELVNGARFAQINLEGADLTEARIYRADLTQARLVGATLDGAVLYDVNLTRAWLSGADLRSADLISVSLAQANLSGACLAGLQAKTDLFDLGAALEMDLTGAHLWEADLTGAYLDEYVKLSYARLTNAILAGAQLHSPSLTAQQLADAVLQDTHFATGLADHPWVKARIAACRDWSPGDPVPQETPDPQAAAPSPP